MAKVFDFSEGKHAKKHPSEAPHACGSEPGSRPARVLALRKKQADLALPTFATFAEHVQTGDCTAAGELLSYLLGVSLVLGLQACDCYQQLLQQEPQADELLAQLVLAIEQNAQEPCLLLLATCFGMQEPQSLLVWQHLSSQTHLRDIPS